jgi:hypothetical protein
VLSSFITDAVEKHRLKLGADLVFNKVHTAALLGWVQRVSRLRERRLRGGHMICRTPPR